ncbi:MAG: hypothetical protein US98_C0004G0002 [Parcubacteria group bacterium GW2011_GWC1_38_6]|nr:MAG: hypothetical protein US98_C0004G0002 [Parcubacteria group bacterium GW2011_GWC1_38_6]
MNTQTIQKLLDVDSGKEHYEAGAVILWCFDARFDPVLGVFLQTMPDSKFDIIKVAGGAKSLASPENESDRDFILRQIQASIRLHNAKKVILMAHQECGAYGGKNDRSFYEEELRRGKSVVEEAIGTEKEIITLFVDFDGVYET